MKEEWQSNSNNSDPIRDKEQSKLSLEERLRANAAKRKSVLTANRIKMLLPSNDLQRLFENIKAATMSLYNLASLEKQQNVLEIKEKAILNEEILKTYPMVYIGAGSDIEYPLSLGARKIIMLDPFLVTPKGVELIRKKIETITNGLFNQEGNHFNFEVDFGEGDESVSVTIDPRLYTRDDDENVPDENKFVPPEEIGSILVFQSEDPSMNDEVMSKLVPGGFVFSNKLPGKIFNEFLGSRPENRDFFVNASSEDKIRMLHDFYKSKGFESYNLDSFEGNYAQTLLKKVGKKN